MANTNHLFFFFFNLISHGSKNAIYSLKMHNENLTISIFFFKHEPRQHVHFYFLLTVSAAFNSSKWRIFLRDAGNAFTSKMPSSEMVEKTSSESKNSGN